jgi:hypothetical protein
MPWWCTFAWLYRWCCRRRVTGNTVELQQVRTIPSPELELHEVNLSLMYPSDGFNWHIYQLLKNPSSELVVLTISKPTNTFKSLAEALVRYDVQEETVLVVQVCCKSRRMADTFVKAFIAARLEHRAHTAIDTKGRVVDMQTSHGLIIRATDREAEVSADVNVVIWPDFQALRDSLAIPFRCSNRQASFMLVCDFDKSWLEDHRTYGFHRLVQLV